MQIFGKSWRTSGSSRHNLPHFAEVIGPLGGVIARKAAVEQRWPRLAARGLLFFLTTAQCIPPCTAILNRVPSPHGENLFGDALEEPDETKRKNIRRPLAAET